MVAEDENVEVAPAEEEEQPSNTYIIRPNYQHKWVYKDNVFFSYSILLLNSSIHPSLVHGVKFFGGFFFTIQTKPLKFEYCLHYKQYKQLLYYIAYMYT